MILNHKLMILNHNDTKSQMILIKSQNGPITYVDRDLFHLPLRAGSLLVNYLSWMNTVPVTEYVVVIGICAISLTCWKGQKMAS